MLKKLTSCLVALTCSIAAGQVFRPSDYSTVGTIAQLPPATSINNAIWVVKDGISSTDCTVGGGSATVWCFSNGLTWTPRGGSGAVNSSTVPLPLAFYPSPGSTVSPTIQSAGALGPSYTPGLNQFSTPNAFGYQPPGLYASSMNRDQKLNTLNQPENFNGGGFGDASQGNDCQAIALAVQYAATNTNGNGKVVDLYHSYRCTKAMAMASLPRDFGDYLNTNMGLGGSVGLTIVNGKIISCSGSGGTTPYNPNAILPVRIDDNTFQGSGGLVHATTGSNGIINDCVVDAPGMNYPIAGEQTTVYPIGSDGAAGNCGSLTGGSFGSVNCTVTAGGYGYTTAPRCGIAYGTSFLQGSAPSCTATVSNGVVTALTLNTVGSGLTWNGSSSGGPVTVCVGYCMNGAQATNLAPETPVEIPIAIPLRAGVTIDCHGNSISADYWTGTADNSQIWIFGDPWGNQGQDVTIKNCKLQAFGDIWFAGPTRNVRIKDNSFAAQPQVGDVHLGTGIGASFAIYMPQALNGTVIEGNQGLSNAAVVVGGIWDSRTGGNGGTGSLGGVDIRAMSTSQAGGDADGLIMTSNTWCSGSNGENLYYWSFFQCPLQQSTGTMTQPGPPIGDNYSQILDSWVEINLWKTPNGPVSNPYAPNGNGSCPITQTVSNRAIDWNYGNIAPASTSFPFYPCFRGVSDMGLVALSRYGYASQIAVNGLRMDRSARPVMLASCTNCVVGNVSTAVQDAYTDPYVPTGALQPGVVDIENQSTSMGVYSAISAPGAGTRFTQALSVTTLQSQDVTQTCWFGITPLGTQTSYQCPQAAQALIVSNLLNGVLPNSGTSTPQGSFGLNAISSSSNDFAFINQTFGGSAIQNCAFTYWLNKSGGYPSVPNDCFTGNGSLNAQGGMTQTGSPTITLGAAAGSGATQAICSGTRVNDAFAGCINITTGGTTATGTLLTISITNNLRHFYATCGFNIQGSTGQYTAWTQSQANVWNFTITSLTAPPTGTLTFTWNGCGGY